MVQLRLPGEGFGGVQFDAEPIGDVEAAVFLGGDGEGVFQKSHLFDLPVSRCCGFIGESQPAAVGVRFGGKGHVDSRRFAFELGGSDHFQRVLLGFDAVEAIDSVDACLLAVGQDDASEAG